LKLDEANSIVGVSTSIPVVQQHSETEEAQVKRVVSQLVTLIAKGAAKDPEALIAYDCKKKVLPVSVTTDDHD